MAAANARDDAPKREPKRRRPPKLASRPVRGTPEETRARLVSAAAELFNRDGYEGTDTNRLARAAGYAPGTFYKHFEDKRQIFLAVYQEWVAKEWAELALVIEEDVATKERAGRIVNLLLSHHKKWCGFRRSLRSLVVSEPEIRRLFRAERRRQLDLVGRMRDQMGVSGGRPEDALLMWTVERAADALADGEAEALGVKGAEMEALLTEMVTARLLARQEGAETAASV